MVEVVAIVEGQTEQTFVRNHLAAHLGNYGITIWAVLSGRSRRHGGVRKWGPTQNDILRTLKEGHYVTTMFDFYAMPLDWPGREEAGQLKWDRRGAHVEQGITKTIAKAAGGSFDNRQLIPYVQVHEFEALLFADVERMAEVLAPVCPIDLDRLTTHFQKILDSAGQPEAINDNFETCPSRRITSLVRAYQKPIHGSIIADRIGLDVLRAACPHFNHWLGQLEELGG